MFLKIKNSSIVNFLIILMVSTTLISVQLNIHNSVIYYIIYVFLSLFCLLHLINYDLDKSKLFIFLPILFLFSIFFGIKLILFSDTNLTEIIATLLNLFIGFYIFINLRVIKTDYLFIIVSFLILSFLIYNYTNINIKDIGGSESVARTYYIFPVIFFLFFHVFWLLYYGKFKKIKYFLIFSLLISILTLSRSTILFLLVALFFSFGKVQKILSIIFISLFTFFGGYFLLTDSPVMGTIERFEASGIDSRRFELWKAYVDNINLTDFIFGMQEIKVNKIKISANFLTENTMHSSIIHSNILLGIIGLFVVFLFVILFIRFYNKRKFEYNFSQRMCCSFAIFAFLSKFVFDKIAFVQRFDFLFYAIFFALIFFNFNKKSNYA